MGRYWSVAMSVNLCMGLCVGYWGSVAVGRLRWVGCGGSVAVGRSMCRLVAVSVPWVGCCVVRSLCVGALCRLVAMSDGRFMCGVVGQSLLVAGGRLL